MPRGVTKELFKEFIPYYDPDMFRAVGRNYRDLVRQADQLAPMERVRAVSRIFSYFRNPDKETVLTPWRVVNMHIGDCIGGYVFFDEAMETESVAPRFIDHGEVTDTVLRIGIPESWKSTPRLDSILSIWHTVSLRRNSRTTETAICWLQMFLSIFKIRFGTMS